LELSEIEARGKKQAYVFGDRELTTIHLFRDDGVESVRIVIGGDFYSTIIHAMTCKNKEGLFPTPQNILLLLIPWR
jgi:hypothetical protein